ncbi:MAG: SDR family oxidoreductase [Xanthobacteraceae bacterium]|nr:SDR family oxidoreductase [Xanthobacteraceae bacterium]PWB66300.1 MAG: 3-oxoacyl-ACP reductase [Bradyrhizobiaceae bacterium]
MTSRIDLEHRIAVVTGGGKGIGRAICERFLDSGATIAIWDRDPALAARTATELKGRGPAFAFQVQVEDYGSVERGRDATLKALGRIDILVNNAGIGGPIGDTFDYPLEAWRRVFAVNLDGAFHCCRALVPHMIAGNYGRIVNIASIAGKEGNPRMAAYSASKAALIALTKSLGKELAGYDIAVNCITPSSAKTDLLKDFTADFVKTMLAKVPRGRFVALEEIAAMAAFCASSECSFTTGAVFDISGGRATY